MDDIRAKKPGKAKKADHGNSRAAAIDLKCEDCCGGSYHEAKRCEVYKCFLWPYGPAGRARIRPAGLVPTEAEYDAMLPDLTADERAEIRARFTGEGANDD